MKKVKEKEAKAIIYELVLKDESTIWGVEVINDLTQFKKLSQSNIANRYDACYVMCKV